jgi:hypothetical protein
MTQALGSKGQIIIQEESVFQTDPGAPDASILYFISETLQQSRPNIDSNVIRGNRNMAKPIRGNYDITGDITTELQAYMALMLKGLFGDVATTGADPYVHTFTVGDSVPSFLIEKGFTDIDQYFKYNGCKVNSMSLSVTSDGAQEISFGILGTKETSSGSSFDDTPTDLGKQSFDGLTVTTIEEGGSPIATVLSADITFENDLDGSIYTVGGGGERQALPEGMMKASGTVTAMFEDLTLYNKAINFTESSLKLIYSFGDGLGSADNESLELYIPELVFAPVSPAIPGPRGVLVELPFSGYYDDSAETSTVQVILKNTQATL